MIKKVKDQTGKELTNADVDIILMKKEVSKIMKSTHATSCTPKDCQCGVDVIEYQLIAFITNALNQQRLEIVEEIREWAEDNEAKNGLFDKENNTSFIPEWPVVFKNDLLRLLTKLEK